MTSLVENKLKKSLARFRERINNGSYYEAQQTIRSITNRYVHAKNYEAAVSLLYQSTLILLESKQYDEAADLYLYMLEVFQDENKEIDLFERDDVNKIMSLITLFPDTDANLGNLAKETSKFLTSKLGNSVGLPKLNFLLGSKLYNSGNVSLISQSEGYLFLSEDAKALEMIIDLEYKTWKTSKVTNDFGLYLARTVLPYLAIKNVKFARMAINEFMERFQKDQPDLQTEAIDGMFIFDGPEETNLNDKLLNCQKLVNFLQLLTTLLSRGKIEDANVFQLLIKRYQDIIKTYDGLLERINEIAGIYYNISFIKKQSNLLQDMMGSFLGGGK